MIILIYYTLLLNDKDFLFELITELISLYIYLINNFFYLVIIYNDIDKSIIVFRYLRLDIVLKINYDNCYLANSNYNLTLTLAR